MVGESTYVKILIESLEKKADILDRLIIKNDEQKNLLSNDDMDEEDFERSLNDKAELIDKLTLLDDGFEEVYLRVKNELERDKEAYKEEIKRMQELISTITDKSMTIKAGEERNRQAAQKRFNMMRGEVQQVKRSKQAATRYYSSMANINYVDAQFMDKRK